MKEFVWVVLCILVGGELCGEETAKVTRGVFHREGKEERYVAEAGHLDVMGKKGQELAEIFYTYYRVGVEDKEASHRPLAFCFNGGPGSSSVWLHLGAMGPVRVVKAEEKSVTTVQRYSLEENAMTALGDLDLVFVDPPATGYTTVAKEVKEDKFFNAIEDADLMSRFILKFVTDKGLWHRPKYLVGESYGGFRVVLIAEELQDRYAMNLDGLILISPLLNFATIDRGGDYSNFLPYLLFLPGYCAVAHHFGKLPAHTLGEPPTLMVERAEAMSVGRYNRALMLGASLDKEEKEEMAQILFSLTGVSKEFFLQNDLRMGPQEFTQKLFADSEEVIGRLDGRKKGFLSAPTYLGGYDPSLYEPLSYFTPAANDYFTLRLGVGAKKNYEVMAPVRPWSYGDLGDNEYASVQGKLSEVLLKNGSCRVLCCCGLYDLATPYYGTVYSINQLLIPEAARRRITLRRYDGGHMFYLDDELLKAFAQDLKDFLGVSDREAVLKIPRL